MLELKDVTRRFGSLTAVDHLSFAAAAGETVGLLGPNGAGKSTTVAMIAGLLRPDSGEVLIGGRRLGGDTDPLKSKIGLVTQELALIDELSASENLHLFAALYDLDRRAARRAVADALDLTGLTERAADKVGTFSGGMKRRLNMAAALLHRPEILLLDEPTVGVDPQSRNAIFDNLETLRERGTTILYTTHYMEEAERLCDRIVILDRGQVIADDTPQALSRLVPRRNVIEVTLEDTAALVPAELLQALPGVEHVDAAPGIASIAVSDLGATMPAVLQWLGDHGHRYQHVATERASLETVFLTLTGRALRDR
jgi:linearmycin/streptolysin S transport system ATP-binding protein